MTVIPLEQRFFCTFGMGHEHANCYVEVEASDSAVAHEAMFAIFERKWAFCCSRKTFQGQPEKWGIRSIGVIYFTGDYGWQWDEKMKGSYTHAG